MNSVPVIIYVIINSFLNSNPLHLFFLRMSVNKCLFCTYFLMSLSFSVTNKFRNKCWSWEKKTNHISIWIFIINVMKGVSLSTHLKVVFYMKRWIAQTSCSFQLTQRWCAPTRRTNVYRDWFRDSGTQLHSGHCQIDWLHSVCQGIGC